MELPKFLHCAITCGATGCRKTEFLLELLEDEYRVVFKYIIFLCPIIAWNKAYKNPDWIVDVKKPRTKNLIFINPVSNCEEKLQELLKYVFNKYAGNPTLYIIDDCCTRKDIRKKICCVN